MSNIESTIAKLDQRNTKIDERLDTLYSDVSKVHDLKV